MRLFVKDPRKFHIAEQAFTRFARDVLGIEDIKKGKDQTSTRRLTDGGLSQVVSGV